MYLSGDIPAWKEKNHARSYQCKEIPDEMVAGAMESAVSRVRTRGSGHKLKHRMFCLNTRHCEVDWALAEIALASCRVFTPGDIQKPPASVPSWAGGWTRWSPEVPPNFSHLVILLLQNISYWFWNYESAFQFLSRHSPPKASQQGKTNLKAFLNCLPQIQICSGHKLMHSNDQLYLGLNKQTSLSTTF